jgi:hypothetical protein
MNTAEKFEHWMEVESSYALEKFKDEDGRHNPAFQYPYVTQGIANGSFSFKSSALTYLRRAEIQAGMAARGPNLGLVQFLGKATHNLVVMDAAVAAYYAGTPTQLARQVSTFGRLAEGLATDADISFNGIVDAETSRREWFEKLQRLQDAGNISGLLADVQPELEYAASQFATAALRNGWPEPGLASGNAEPWHIDQDS